MFFLSVRFGIYCMGFRRFQGFLQIRGVMHISTPAKNLTIFVVNKKKDKLPYVMLTHFD